MKKQLYDYEPIKNVAGNNISKTIKKLIKKYKILPTKINSGNCESFANDLLKVVGGSIYEVPFEHIFLKWKNKYYDAEAIDGVINWKDLPYFKRCSAIADTNTLNTK